MKIESAKSVLSFPLEISDENISFYNVKLNYGKSLGKKTDRATDDDGC